MAAALHELPRGREDDHLIVERGREALVGNVIKLIVGLIALAVIVLVELARRYPDVAWLRHFRLYVPKLSARRQALGSRRSYVLDGIQLILAALFLPVVVVGSSVMLFMTPGVGWLIFTAIASLTLLALGIRSIVKGVRIQVPPPEEGESPWQTLRRLSRPE